MQTQCPSFPIGSWVTKADDLVIEGDGSTTEASSSAAGATRSGHLYWQLR